MAGGFKVSFFEENKEVVVQSGTTISDAAKAAGVKIELPCAGKGRCGRCAVHVSDSKDGTPARVLACTTKVEKNIFVKIPSGDGAVVASNDYRKVRIGKISPVVKGKDPNYGVAVDIGTTTIAVSVTEMNNGLDLYSAAGENRQRLRGEDVLARIQYAEEGGTEELRTLVTDSINDLIDVCLDRRCSPDSMNAVYVSGNTTMIHLFLGIDPSPIRMEPYEPVVKKAEISGAESGLRVNPDAKVICMPSVSSYVGGDVTSDIVSSGMDVSNKMSLLIDVGTNGEVALGDKEIMMVCSSSAGPAFEGGQTTSGMLARIGAIDSVKIVNGKIEFTTIGSADPKGICGSGIIDLTAEMFKNGWIDKKGSFTGKAKTEAENGTAYLRIVGDVRISQDDIYTIILTKAAIYSSTEALVKNMGISFDDLETIYIAGGFGNFIGMENAITIGLFPDVPREKYAYIGNSSLAGAKYALLSSSFRARIDKVFDRMTYLDLGSNPLFFDEYSSAQFLPHTDISRFPSVRQ